MRGKAIMNIEDVGYRYIEFSRDDRILTVSLNRPDVRNAVNADMHSELSSLFYDLADDEHSDVIVLTGSGKAFCAGGDIAWMQAAIDNPDLFEHTIEEAKRIHYGQLELTKPVICRVNGHAIGLGASIALLCDIVYAADDALIGDPHVCVGLVAGDGGCVIWPQLIGYVLAKEFLLTGEPVTAGKAQSIGLINGACSGPELDDVVYGMARKLAGGALKAVRWTKATINLPLKQIAHQVFETGAAYEMLSNLSADHQEAVSAFREHRKPSFRAKEPRSRDK